MLFFAKPFQRRAEQATRRWNGMEAHLLQNGRIGLFFIALEIAFWVV